MKSQTTEQVPRIVREAEKIVHDLYVRMERYERWRQKAVAETMERRREEAARMR